ncbi:hypothetical protein CPB83DRAFT_449618 [Crepidotus variabilis]|uniref:Uncharacterized protein n=1 Tax=Crepidotus variabilis TaxID=179855 RepID=A0A9P6ECU9_9AGAR|nr:hypothetical protein CPB83DRAFT_449618 [Crepidotus variabilis]
MSYDVTMPYIPVDSLSDVVYRLVVDQYDPPPDYQLGFWAIFPLHILNTTRPVCHQTACVSLNSIIASHSCSSPFCSERKCA